MKKNCDNCGYRGDNPDVCATCVTENNNPDSIPSNWTPVDRIKHSVGDVNDVNKPKHLNWYKKKDGVVFKKGVGVGVEWYDTVDFKTIHGRSVVGDVIDISDDGFRIRPLDGSIPSFTNFDWIYDIKVTCRSNERTSNSVNHPNHYQSKTGLEVIDVIDAFTHGLDGVLAFDTGNVIKYICRWKQKNGLEDLKKAKWYLEDLINHLEKEN